MQIKVNPNAELVTKLREQLKKNDGYCPCALKKIPETKCMCKEFLESEKLGACHCGLYIKN